MATAPTQISPPATVAEVANEFLALANRDGLADTIDQMKLQKLLFYAHAWHLAYGRGPLFENDFEAWPWGPVVRDVYVQTKSSGRSAVKTALSDLRRAANGSYGLQTPDGVCDSLKPFIESVWQTLKAYSGIQLSNSTHADGEPWTIVASAIGTGAKPVIPNHLIEQVFKGKLSDAANTAAAA
jgi:uncharacterized phage-associated protein